KGGALETVINGKTGLFFKEQKVEDLIECVRNFEKIEFDKNYIRDHAKEFDEEIFKEKILRFINEKQLEFKNKKKWTVI
ncbi:MAG: glycosyltransferase family 4 protein, partial [Clostridium baratii]|nr:glycosyltransferase family 4 protein [Clostridium baratii]